MLGNPAPICLGPAPGFNSRLGALFLFNGFAVASENSCRTPRARWAPVHGRDLLDHRSADREKPSQSLRTDNHTSPRPRGHELGPHELVSRGFPSALAPGAAPRRWGSVNSKQGSAPSNSSARSRSPNRPTRARRTRCAGGSSSGPGRPPRASGPAGDHMN